MVNRTTNKVLMRVSWFLQIAGMVMMVLSLVLPFILFEYLDTWGAYYRTVVVYPISGQFFPILFFSGFSLLLLCYSTMRGVLGVRLYAAAVASITPIVLLGLSFIHGWSVAPIWWASGLDARLTTLEGFNLYLVSLGVLWFSTLLAVVANRERINKTLETLLAAKGVLRTIMLRYSLLALAVSLQIVGLFLYFYGGVQLGLPPIIHVYGFETLAGPLFYVAFILITYYLLTGPNGSGASGIRHARSRESSSGKSDILIYSSFVFMIVSLSVSWYVYSMTHVPILEVSLTAFPGFGVFLVGCILFFLFVAVSYLPRRTPPTSSETHQIRNLIIRNRMAFISLFVFLWAILMDYITVAQNLYDEIVWLNLLLAFPTIIGLDAVILSLSRHSFQYVVDVKHLLLNAVKWMGWVVPVYLGFSSFHTIPLAEPTWLAGLFFAPFFLFLVDTGLVLFIGRR